MTDKVNIQIFNWGPCVVRMKITDEFKNLLLSEAESNKIDYTDKLAGILDKETGYSEESKKKIIPHLSECLGVYDQAFERYVNKPYDLDIPEALKKEHAEYKGKSCGPGGIQFIYGNGPRDCITYMSFMPEENDMFIFPAWLKHYVAPYKSNVTRISVSGNVHDSAPLNNIEKFAPEYDKERIENEQYLKELKKKL